MAASQAELLHPVGQLLLDGVGDEAGGRVLADVPDDVRAVARRQVQDALAVEEHVARQRPPVKARHQAGEHAEQRGLPDAGAARRRSTSSPSSRVEVDVASRTGGAGRGVAEA